MQYKIYIALLIAMLLACKKIDSIQGVDQQGWQPELALSLVNTSFSVQDALDNFEADNGYIEVDQDGLLKVVYTGRVFSLNSQPFLQSNAFSIPVPSATVTNQINFPLNMNLDQALIKSGVMDYHFVNPLNESIDLTLSFYSIQNGGQYIELQYELSANESLSEQINLQGMEFNFQQSNNFLFEYRAEKQSDQSNVILATAQLDFSPLTYEYMQGYIPNLNFPLPKDSINIDFMKNWKSGEIFFQEPSIEVSIKNSFGLPVSVNFQELYSNTRLQGRLDLQNSPLNQQIDLAYPSLQEVGEDKESILYINGISNLGQIIQNIPHDMIYQADVLLNPQNLPSRNTFISENSRVDIDVHVSFPMYGWVRNLVMYDTLDINLADFDNFEEVDFKLLTDNGLPLSAYLQAYFIDDQNQIIDSLFSNSQATLLKAAAVDNTSFVTEHSTEELHVLFTQARYKRLYQSANRVVLRSKIQSTNADQQQNIKIQAGQLLKLQLGARGIVKL